MHILKADEIRLLRTEWLDDLVDQRPEWGANPLAESASLGALTLSLSGLTASATLTAGTAFTLLHNGRSMTYYLSADASVTPDGLTTISFAPALIADVITDTPVKPDERRRSLFNKRVGRQFFSDADLQDYAKRAMTQRGAAIESSDEPKQMWFRAIRYYAWTMMLASDEYQIAVLANDERGTNAKLLESKRALLLEDADIVFGDRMGGLCVGIDR